MIGQELRQLQEALNRKANTVQHEFSAVSEKLQELSQRIAEVHGADLELLIAEQEALHERQQMLAEEINLWRERAWGALSQPGDEALRTYLGELLASNDESVRPAVEHVLYVLNATEKELTDLAHSQARARPTTPVGRLVERARTEFDLRGDPTQRQKTAFEFANRSGMAQDDEALAELEAALEDRDPLVKEVVALTLIQMRRFRAMHLGDLDAVYVSVQALTHLKHRAVIPVLIEILETPRTGFVYGEGEMIEGNNRRSREAALRCLAEWRTPEAQAAVRARQRDRDPQIAQEATHVLELYPGEWQ